MQPLKKAVKEMTHEDRFCIQLFQSSSKTDFGCVFPSDRRRLPFYRNGKNAGRTQEAGVWHRSKSRIRSPILRERRGSAALSGFDPGGRRRDRRLGSRIVSEGADPLRKIIVPLFGASLEEWIRAAEISLALFAMEKAKSQELENVKFLISQNAAIFIDKELGAQQILGLLHSPNRLKEMKENCEKLARPQAAEDIYKLAAELTKN